MTKCIPEALTVAEGENLNLGGNSFAPVRCPSKIDGGAILAEWLMRCLS